MKPLNFLKTTVMSMVLVGLFAPSTSFALRKFLPEYDDSRNPQGAILYEGYKKYKTEKIANQQTDANFTKDTNGSGSVQVKTVFDFYDTRRAERIEYVKKELLSQMKDRTIWPVGDEGIDTIINKLQGEGKYFVIRTEGDIIPIDANTLIYLYDYKLEGKENLVHLVKQQVQKLQSEEDMINLEQRNTELNNILKTLDKFKVKYLRLGRYTNGKVYVGRGNGVKIEGTENFFINKLFTTPELNELIDSKDSKAIYFWTYIPNTDFKTKYYSNNDGLNNDVFVELLGDTIFGGTVKKDVKVYENKLFGSTQDNFIYTIKENKFEYYILALCFILGVGLGGYMTFNFIYSFKNNFKKTPEEI